MPKNFNYDLGNTQEGLLPEFLKTETTSLDKIRKRLPTLTYTESRDVDAVVKERMRLVEFAEAYDYSDGKLLRFLRYWKSVTNIFDLEFFINKLASSAFAIANVEKMVLSGVPFYEEGDDALFADMDETEEEEVDHRRGAKKPARQTVTKFDDDGHKPLKNVLATKASEKVALEKQEKRQLIQDLETIKDKFTFYFGIMKKQEMASNLGRAE